MFPSKTFSHTWLPVSYVSRTSHPRMQHNTARRWNNTRQTWENKLKKKRCFKKRGRWGGRGDVDPRIREIWEQKRLGGSEGSRTRKRIIRTMEAHGGHTTHCSTTLFYRICPLVPRVTDRAKGKALRVQDINSYNPVDLLFQSFLTF
jgi:hypothetical protein